MKATHEHLWWQYGIVYQIYPRSYQDSNGDGVGDLPGILSRLDYLKWLGVDAIWISPIYPSQMADFAYNISAYEGILPLLVSLVVFEKLVMEVQDREMRFLLDFVL